MREAQNDILSFFCNYRTLVMVDLTSRFALVVFLNINYH